jgi:Ca2+-transporting ATPase
VHRNPEGDLVEVVKGTPETVLGLVVPGRDVAAARLEVERLARLGHRVLALVEDRVLLGLVAVDDPPHPAAADVVEECRAAGIRTVLITGDHPATARVVAERRELALVVGIVTNASR